jgi:hypothetical protein
LLLAQLPPAGWFFNQGDAEPVVTNLPRSLKYVENRGSGDIHIYPYSAEESVWRSTEQGGNQTVPSSSPPWPTWLDPLEDSSWAEYFYGPYPEIPELGRDLPAGHYFLHSIGRRFENGWQQWRWQDGMQVTYRQRITDKKEVVWEHIEVDEL